MEGSVQEFYKKRTKQKSGKEQETVKGKQKKKDFEMQPISTPLTPVAQAFTDRTDRLYNDDDKIYKGGPVKRSSTKTATPKATRGRGRLRKNSSVNNSAV